MAEIFYNAYGFFIVWRNGLQLSKLLKIKFERIAVLLYRWYIVHEPVVFELRVVPQYRSVRDAGA